MHVFPMMLEIILLTSLGGSSAYLLMLSVLSLFARSRTTFEAERRRMFAVIIPAHNEEPVIAATLESLRLVAYPRESFDIIVIADNCTDKTSAIAARAGVQVLERSNHELKGKGFALRWGFDRLLQEVKYDAFVILDADSVALPNLLQVMNYYLEHGAEAIQATDIVAPREGPRNLEMIRIGFLLHNYVRPVARRILGFHTILHGNGMCFSRGALERVPWDAFSLAEDVEYGLKLLLGGIPAVFAPEAVVHALMPHNQSNAQTQRVRWESGRLHLIRKYSLPLLKSAVARMSFQYIDVFLELVIPTLVNLVGLSLLSLFVTFVATLLDTGLPSVYVGAWICVVSAGFGHVIIGIYAAHAEGFTYRALFGVPQYAAWKTFTLIKAALKRRKQEWIRTTRE